MGKLYKLELSIEARGDDARELCFKRATLIFTRPIVRCKDIYTTMHINEAISLVLVRAPLEYRLRMTSYSNKT